MFIDASALVAIMLGEPDGEAIEARLRAARQATTSGIAIWETVRAVARETGTDHAEVRTDLKMLLALRGVTVIPIDDAIATAAIAAHARFGKGRHPARLNMGDCFAYACAVTRGLALLYKGDDFDLTDVPRA